MKVISVCNGKGGVGKTTTTAHIGAAISSFGKKVLLVDLDANKSLTGFFKIDIETADDPITALDVMARPNRFTFSDSAVEINSNLSLSPVRRNEASSFEKVFETRKEALLNLKTAVSMVKEEYDYIIIDTPGNIDSIYLKMSILASNCIVIPIGPSDLDIEPTMAFLDILDDTISRYNPGLKDVRFLATKIKTRAQYNMIMNMFDEETVKQLCEAKIGHRVVFERTSMEGMTIIESDKNHKGAKEYLKLAREVM